MLTYMFGGHCLVKVVAVCVGTVHINWWSSENEKKCFVREGGFRNVSVSLSSLKVIVSTQNVHKHTTSTDAVGGGLWFWIKDKHKYEPSPPGNTLLLCAIISLWFIITQRQQRAASLMPPQHMPLSQMLLASMLMSEQLTEQPNQY